METGTHPQSSPFLKSLASSNSHTRREAVTKLRQYLQGHAAFTQLDMLKLWKGLYYCMWMSDRPKAQQQLARDLAGLVQVIREENVLGWLEAFWTTVSREWSSIDALRMNKFLYLVRQYLYATFRHLARNSWSDKAAVRDHMALLSSIPLNPTEDRIPNGLRYHMLDIYVDELDRIDLDREGNMPVNELLRPVQNLLRKSPYKIVRTRAEEALADRRLKDWQVKEEKDEADEIEEDSQSDGESPNQKTDGTKKGGDADMDEEWTGIDDG